MNNESLHHESRFKLNPTLNNSKYFIHSATLKDDTEKQKEDEEKVPETSEAETIPENLPVLEPGDQLLINSVPQKTQDLTKLETPSPEVEVQRRNVLDKITDRGKNIISILYPPYEEERNEQKFDDLEREKAKKYALSTDQILLTDELGMKPVEVASRHVSQPTPLAQVVEGRVVTEAKEILEDNKGNSKLWIGKDYTNFIVKDFTNLDLPFVGKFSIILRSSNVFF